MSLAFHIRGLPPKATAQGKGAFAMKGGGIRFFKKAAQRAAESTLHAMLLPHRPAAPLSGPLSLSVTFYFPWRKGEKKGRVKAHKCYPIETRPDVDNLFKQLGDTMTTLRFWNDDAQIASLRVSKFYADEPGITIALTSCLATSRDGAQVSP